MENSLSFISPFFLLSGISCALIILFHIFPRHRQSMKIMEAVWPLTGLWANWIGLWAYYGIGKTQKHTAMGMSSHMNMDMPARPLWQSITLSTLHCGAGCTLADLIGETFTSFVPVSIAGSLIAGQWVLDYILALLLGIYFQYAAIRPMEQLPRLKVIGKALKIDFLSLTAWQVGMYGWMAIVIFVFHQGNPLPHSSWNFWFMMQIAMFFGFLTSWPVNWMLIKTGIKHGM